MTTQIDSNNIQPATLAALTPVTVTQVQITDSSWTVLDDSAVSTSGGYIVITGNNFQAGCNVIINNTNATSVSLVSSTVLRVQVPALAAGTYVLYVTNTNGGTAIVVNGLTYSGTPTWVTASPLPDQNVGVAISIQFSATGDAPIVYSVQAGSSLPPGLSLSTSGLLSGTVTGLTSNTTYNFTIVAVDPQFQDSPKAFAVTLMSGDQYFSYVTTLLSASTPTILPFNDDVSTNNSNITIVGDTRPYGFSPYTPGYYSNYFDGNGDNLSLTSQANLALGSGDFTLECWVYNDYTAIPTNATIYDQRNGTSGAGVIQPVLELTSATGYNWYVAAANAISSTTTPVKLKTWQHIAVSKVSGNTRMYVDGVQVGSTYVDTRTYPAGSLTIGRANDGVSTQSYTGNISNLRVLVGTGLYSGTTITVPTAPLTAITNTQLLTCQSNRLIDNSTNNFTITRIGDVSIKSFVPFIPNSSYSGYGSTYFDGSGDYLTTAGTPINFGTGNFTIEWSVYRVSAYTADRDELPMGGVGGTSFMLGMQNGVLQFGVSATSWNIVSSITIPLNTWAYCSIVRSGTTVTMYIDGAVAGSTTLSTNFTGATAFDIGRRQGSAVNAIQVYCSNLRIVNGTAVYTAAFTPPTSPLTAVANTSLLTCQTNQPVNNNTFLDSSTNNFLVTRAGNATQGTLSPYGTSWSNYFDGNGDYLSLTPNSSLTLDGDYTIELWIYFTSLDTVERIPVNCWNTGAGWLISTQSNAWNFKSAGSLSLTYSAVAPVAGQWYHVAATRSGSATNNVKFFINGVQVAQGTNTSTLAPAASSVGCVIGGGQGGTGQLITGYISNVRVVKGTAVYTANFTPSTTPLQSVTGTSLLTCQSNRIVDNSANNFTITRNGDTSVQKFSPFAGTTLPTPYYSAYFDGTGDYLTAPANTAYAFGTGNFTIEAWVFRTADASGAIDCIVTNRNTSFATGQWALYAVGSTVEFDYRTSITQNNTVTASLDYNTWTHVAVVRNGTSYTMYKNGQVAQTKTISALEDIGSASYNIAIGSATNGAFPFSGYISNSRIVKGTAVYTSAFTPSTAPLTAISGTSLLTCQSNTFVDNSTNNFAITAVGDTKPTTVAPFTVTYSTKQSYTPAVFGGSMYFDGTGDYLTIAASPQFLFAGDFTIEGWMYFTNIAGASPQVLFGVKSGATEFDVRWFTTRWQISLNAGAGTDIGTTPAPVNNSWVHVACVRSGSSIKLYVNGTQTSTTLTNSTALGQAASAASIGGNNAGSNLFTGYISDVRVNNGTALYSSNFVPQNQPVTAIKNTTLLVNGTSAGIYDSSEINDLETVGDTKLNTGIVKYGNTSMYFDGTGDYLSIPSSPNLNLGSGNFTIEMWAYKTMVGDTFTLFQKSGSYELKVDAGRWVWQINTTTNVFVTNGTLTNATWTHVAMVRNGATSTLYVNGVAAASGTSTNANDNTSPLLIASGSVAFGGYLSDFRFTKGIARYTANFTPPTSPFITF